MVDKDKFFAGFSYYTFENNKIVDISFVPGVVSIEKNKYKISKNIKVKNEVIQYGAEDNWYKKENYPFSKAKIEQTYKNNEDYFYSIENMKKSNIGIPINLLSDNNKNIDLSFKILNSIRLTRLTLETIPRDSFWLTFKDRYQLNMVENAKDYWTECTLKYSKNNDLIINDARFYACNVMGAFATSVDSDHVVDTTLALVSMMGYGMPSFNGVNLFFKYVAIESLFIDILNIFTGVVFENKLNLKLNDFINLTFANQNYKLFTPTSLPDALILAASIQLKGLSFYDANIAKIAWNKRELLLKNIHSYLSNFYSASSEITKALGDNIQNIFK